MKAVKFLLVVATLSLSTFAHSDVLPCQKAAASDKHNATKAALREAPATPAVVKVRTAATGADSATQQQ